MLELGCWMLDMDSVGRTPLTSSGPRVRCTGVSVVRQAPYITTGMINEFLKMLAKELGPADHAALIMDQVGWHNASSAMVRSSVVSPFRPARAAPAVSAPAVEVS